MQDKWMIHAKEFSNCNCAYGCPCQFNAPATHGFCEAIANFEIIDGFFNDTKLDGVKFLGIFKWPGQIADGNGKAQLIIDEKTTPAQREAVLKIASGQSTAPGTTIFSVFASTLSEVKEPIYVPIKMEVDVEKRRAHIHVKDLVESRGEPLINPFSGNEDRRGIYNPNGFEYTYAEVGSGNTRATAGLQLGLINTYGQFCYLHMNQDGVIHDKEPAFAKKHAAHK